MTRVPRVPAPVPSLSYQLASVMVTISPEAGMVIDWKYGTLVNGPVAVPKFVYGTLAILRS